MRGVPLVVVAVLAACSGDHGVSLGVSAPPDVTSVDLLIAPTTCQNTLGDEACKNADGVVWDTTRVQHSGEVFIQSNDEVVTATVENGVARFHLESEAGADYASRIVLIGYDVQKAPVAYAMLRDVTIPIHNAVEWQVALRALPDISDSAAAQESVHVWKPTTGARTCVAYEHEDGTFEYVVPAVDSDCDEQMPECNEFWYHFAADKTGTACVTDTPNNVCEVGSSACVDGVNGGDVCRPEVPEICTTQTFCDQCDQISALCVDKALLNATSSNGLVLQCKFPTDLTGMPCLANGMVPSNNSGTATALSQQMAALGSSCSSVAFIPPKVPLQASTKFTTPTGATFSIARQDGPCDITVTWDSGMIDLNQTTPIPVIADIKVTGTGRQLLIPVTLEFTRSDTCPIVDTSAQLCSFHGLAVDNPILQCAGPN